MPMGMSKLLRMWKHSRMVSRAVGRLGGCGPVEGDAHETGGGCDVAGYAQESGSGAEGG